eukprot:gene17837-53482_t
MTWPSTPPPSSPLRRSASTVTARNNAGGAWPADGPCAIDADTWFPTVGADGVMWSSWTDGGVRGARALSQGANATTGWAGYSAEAGLAGAAVTRARRWNDESPPHARTAARVGTTVHSAAPLAGRYPCAVFSVNGTWVYGTGSCDNGPRVGRSWSVGPGVGVMDAGAHNLFRQWPWPADDQPFQFKLTQPFFVDHGRNNEHSPDGAAYL